MIKKIMPCLLLLISLSMYSQNNDCRNVKAMTLNFAGGSVKLSALHMNILTTLAKQMRSSPNCKVVVSGLGQSSKMDLQRGWDRANAVINYLVEKQAIDRDRFIFLYGTEGPSAVSFRPASDNEGGPSDPPAPFPHLHRR
jgi:OmpA-OmpF porin, OOP family